MMTKWNSQQVGDDYPSDAITSCLRTTGNTLSFWEIEKEDQINDAILAIASAGTNLDKVDVVIIPKETMSEFQLISSEVVNPYSNFEKNHRDVINLTYTKMRPVADIICSAIVKNEYRQFTRANVKKLIQEAIDQRKIIFDRINEKMRDNFNPPNVVPSE